MHARSLILILALIFPTLTSSAEDWPGFLGPKRNATTTGPKLATSNLDNPKRFLWQKQIGSGFAGPAVAQNNLILFHRIGNQYHVDCLNKSTGKAIWQHKFDARYRDDFGFDNGPRTVPTIAQNKIYLHTPEGILLCLDLKTGKPLWQIDTVKTFDSEKGFFGRACSPIVHNNTLILHTGSEDHGIIGINATTGKHLWSATDHEAGYASPIIATINKQTLALCFTRTGLVVLSPDTGKTLDTYRWRARMHASVNAATPIVANNHIFLTTSYNTGAILLKWENNKLQKVWANDTSLSSHYASCVRHQNLIFGYHGRQEQGPTIRAIELTTGKVKWEHDNNAAGSVIKVNDKLLILSEKGQLTIAKATADKFTPLTEVQILGFKTRAFPAYADGLFFARDTRKLICLDLRIQ